MDLGKREGLVIDAVEFLYRVLQVVHFHQVVQEAGGSLVMVEGQRPRVPKLNQSLQCPPRGVLGIVRGFFKGRIELVPDKGQAIPTGEQVVTQEQ